MKKICVFNQKGGVGKTTTNINLASYLSLEGFKTLVIDMDPQGNASSGLGVDKNKFNWSMYDLFVYDRDINSLIIESDIIKNLYLIPSSINLAAAEVELINIKNMTASRCQPQSGISKCFLFELRRSAVATKDTGYYCARSLWW